MRIRALRRELAGAVSSSLGSHQVAGLEKRLEDANIARERYQAELIEAHRENLLLQANLQYIRSGRNGNEQVHLIAGKSKLILIIRAQTATALRLTLDQMSEVRDALLKDKEALESSKDDMERHLRAARANREPVGPLMRLDTDRPSVSLVDRDQRDMLACQLVRALRSALTSS